MFAAILYGPALSFSLGIDCDRSFADRSAPLAVQVIVQAELAQRGKIVSVSDLNLEMSDQDGKNKRMYPITKAAKITLNSKGVPLAELKKGDSVTITLAEGVVIKVDAVRAKPSEIDRRGQE